MVGYIRLFEWKKNIWEAITNNSLCSRRNHFLKRIIFWSHDDFLVFQHNMMQRSSGATIQILYLLFSFRRRFNLWAFSVLRKLLIKKSFESILILFAIRKHKTHMIIHFLHFKRVNNLFWQSPQRRRIKRSCFLLQKILSFSQRDLFEIRMIHHFLQWNSVFFCIKKVKINYSDPEKKNKFAFSKPCFIIPRESFTYEVKCFFWFLAQIHIRLGCQIVCASL